MITALEVRELIGKLHRLEEFLDAEVPPHVQRLLMALATDPRFEDMRVVKEQSYVRWCARNRLFRCLYAGVPLDREGLLKLVEMSAE